MVDDEPDVLIPLNFLRAAERVDAELIAGGVSDEVYEASRRRAVTELTEQATSQAALVGRIAREERERQELFIRSIWGEGFDLLLSTVLLGKAAAEWRWSEEAQLPRGSVDPRVRPLCNIVGRVVRTASEVHWLLAGGFAAGALARARSIYELALTSRLLADHGDPGGTTPDLVERYERSHDLERYADARVHNDSAPAELRFSTEQMDKWKAEADEARLKFGTDIGRPRGWAKPLFPNKNGMAQIPDLEEPAGFEAQRPFYRWANHEVHATARGGALSTYVNNDGYVVQSTGRTHRGLAEPASMAARYLSQAIADLLLTTGAEPSTMANVTVETINHVIGEMDAALVAASAQAESTPFIV